MFNYSGWGYDTSAGLGAGISGEVIEVGGQTIQLFVKSPNGESYQINAMGAGGGVGISAIPASITGSLKSFPSVGTSIYTAVNDGITVDDLSSLMLIYTGAFTVAVGNVYGSLILFVNAPWTQFLYLSIPIAGPLLAASKVIKGFCLVAGVQGSTPNVGADATGMFFKVFGTDKV